MWTEIENDDGLSYRAILEDYLVFLRYEPADLSRRRQKKQHKSGEKSRSTGEKSRSTGEKSRSTGDWYVYFLIPDDERNKAYLAGEGFSRGTSLERAQDLAFQKALELRGALSRQQKRKVKP